MTYDLLFVPTPNLRTDAPTEAIIEDEAPREREASMAKIINIMDTSMSLGWICFLIISSC